MVVKEHKLGKGTIAYSGESAEYWAAKSAVRRRRGIRITVGLGLIALALGVWMISSWGPRIESAQVIGSSVATSTSAGPSSEAWRIQVLLPDGARSSYSSATTRSAGSLVTVSAFSDGRVIEGPVPAISLWVVAGVFGAVAAGRGVWQFRNRHIVTTFR